MSIQHQVHGPANRREHATGKPNSNYVRRKLPVQKVDASTVPAVFQADAISRADKVWAGFDGERVVCVGATADECRAKYRTWERRQPLAEQLRLQRDMGHGQREVPQNLED
jgi:hypothetical protein